VTIVGGNDLWSGDREKARRAVEPLAVRMRPRSLEEFAGQEHLLGVPQAGAAGKPGATLLRRMIEGGAITSVILHGPPGTGKTTLARLIAQATGRQFVRENAANVSVKRIREVAEDSARRIENGLGPTALFLDEIHRFSRSQQDVLLDDVERGLLTLIGATTENPLFAVNSALVSRSTLFRLEPLRSEDVQAVVRRAIADPERGYGRLALRVSDEAIALWAEMSEGDARRALNALEVAVLSTQGGGAVEPAPRLGRGIGESAAPITIDVAEAEASIQRKAIVYDGTGDEHYDTISAFIKSVRGSDPDAAIYWLAVMLEAGEDVRFIARRLAILASEDIGNADPRGIMVAQAAWELVERIGMPEARITLAQATTYLALAPKSNAAYQAINEAMEDVRYGRTIPVPLFLRDPTKAKSVGSADHGKGYEYSHDAQNRTSVGGVTGQSYLGVEKSYYRPKDVGTEKMLAERLEEVKRARKGRDLP
jgi:putative ATPase